MDGSAPVLPKAVISMWEGLADDAFPTPARAELSGLVDLVIDGVVGAWGDVSDDVLREVEVVVGHWGCAPLDPQVLDRMPKLRLFAYAGGSVKEGGTVGPEVFRRGITVTSAAAANAVAVAEYTLAIILLANKGAFVAREQARSAGRLDLHGPAALGNAGKRIGVIGASRTGRRLVELLAPFDLEVVVADPYLDAEGAALLGVELVSIGVLLASADVVTIHAPLTAETNGLIGAAELAAMKDGAVLINTARGLLVDTRALGAELATGRISAVLDVTWPEPLPRDSPLLALPNAFVTPHVAGSAGTELTRLTDAAIGEVRRFVTGEPPMWPVLPEAFDRLA